MLNPRNNPLHKHASQTYTGLIVSPEHLVRGYLFILTNHGDERDPLLMIMMDISAPAATLRSALSDMVHSRLREYYVQQEQEEGGELFRQISIAWGKSAAQLRDAPVNQTRRSPLLQFRHYG